jgi:hypothetical protein
MDAKWGGAMFGFDYILLSITFDFANGYSIA